jgi:hypothetical protein
VENIGNNTFRTVFPNKTELQRMVEWGVVQSKFNNAKLKIGEKVTARLSWPYQKFGSNSMNFQRSSVIFFTIWVVGSILGTTKYVDMVFSRKHEIGRM